MSNRSAGISKKKLTIGTQKTKQMGKNAVAVLTTWVGGGFMEINAIKVYYLIQQ